MRPQVITFPGMTTADADGVSASQTPAAGGSQELTINGALASSGVAAFDIPRRASITSAADDSGRVFVITGTNRYGESQTESVTGPNTTTVVGVKDFLTITSVAIDDDSAGALTVGSSDEAATAWIPVDIHRVPINIGFAMNLSSDANFTWTVQQTQDNPLVGTPELVFNHSKTGDFNGAITTPIMAYRVLIDHYVAGSGVFTAAQAGLV